jgi:hypothetical protein
VTILLILHLQELGVEKITFTEDELSDISAGRACLSTYYGSNEEFKPASYWTSEGYPDWSSEIISSALQHEYKEGKYKVSISCIDDDTPYVIDTLYARGDTNNGEPWKFLTRIYSFRKYEVEKHGISIC